MRILLITDQLTLAGGAEVYFFTLKKYLKTTNLEVFSIGFGEKTQEGEDYFILKGANSKFVKLIWRFFIHPIKYWQLRQKIQKFQPDVIHLHQIKQYSATLLLAIHNYPVICTVHDYGLICPVAQNIHLNQYVCDTGIKRSCFWQHRVKHNRAIYLLLVLSFYLLRKRLRKKVSAFIAPSPLLQHYLKQNNFKNVAVIPPFQTVENLPPFAKIKSNHFLFVGYLGCHKGLDHLIDEFFLAVKQHPHLILRIAGEGPEKIRLQHKVNVLNLTKNIFFLGWQKNLSLLYQESIALIFPSIGMESFGLVMTEAMGHAKPILGANRSSVPWIIDDEKTGLLFDPLQRGDLAKKILLLAKDEAYAKALGLNGYKKLKNMLDNQTILNQIIASYKAIAVNPL